MSKKIGKHHSVITMVSLFLILLVMLFIGSTVFSYSILSEFQKNIVRFTNTSFPEVIRSGKIFHQVSELTFSAEGLTHATSNASRRIAFKNINLQINEIKKVLSEEDVAIGFFTQLNAISVEFTSLNKLIEQQLSIQEKVTEKEKSLYAIHEKLLDYSRRNHKNTVDDNIENNWVLTFSAVIILSEKALANSRLQNVRQVFKKVTKDLIKLNKDIKLLSPSYQANAEKLIEELENILLHKEGLLSLKIMQLRVVGRAIGRGNFVKNMSSDFARVVEFRSYEINNNVIKKTRQTAEHLSSQAKLMALIAFFVLLLLFSIIYFIKTRLVERLVKLNKKVQARLNGEDIDLTISGNDEISDIASSFNYFAETVEEQKRILHDLSQTDGLTGIANRRAFDERLLVEIGSAKRNSKPMSLLLADIDFFKAYNDNYGHLAGDECLKLVALTLTKCKQRSTDFLARYGGEEFVFILPNTDLEGANNFAKTVLKKIKQKNIEHNFSQTSSHITLSIGIALYFPQEDNNAEMLLAKADEALYLSKANGKNCAHFL